MHKIQNVPGDSVIFQMDFRINTVQNKKFYPQNGLAAPPSSPGLWCPLVPFRSTIFKPEVFHNFTQYPKGDVPVLIGLCVAK
jgi:hypothetical protein